MSRITRRSLIAGAGALAIPKKAKARFASFQTFKPSPAAPTGWITFTPSSDTLISYVSDSIGNDGTAVQGTQANGWDCTHPYKTIAAGRSALRTGGHPDWLLLKQGDTFVDQWFGNLWTGAAAYSGSSATILGDGSYQGMMVFGSYDPSQPGVADPFVSGNVRPIVKTNPSIAGGGDFQLIGSDGGSGAAGKFFALTGIEGYAYTRNPTDPGYNAGTAGTSPAGIFWKASSFAPVVLIIQNNKLSFYNSHAFTPGPGLTTDQLIMRRNVIVDNYDTVGHAVGVYTQCIPFPTFQENIYINNGNNSPVPAQGRNLYLGSNSSADPSGSYQSTLIGEISSQSSSGNQMRTGGSMSYVLSVQDAWGWDGGHFGASEAPQMTNWQVDHCVVTELTGSGSVHGFFPQYSTAGATIALDKCLVNMAPAPQNNYGFRLGDPTATFDAHNCHLTNSVVWDFGTENTYWAGASGNTAGVEDGDPATSSFSGNNIDPTNINTLDAGTQPPHWRASEPFPDPTNGTIAAYLTSKGYAPATVANYLTLLRAQNKNNWDNNLMAQNVITFILAKYGITT